MALEGVWDEVGTWETVPVSTLSMKIKLLPDGEYKVYFLDLDNDRTTTKQIQFTGGEASTSLDTSLGTLVLYQTIKRDEPVKIGTNIGVTE